MYIDNIPVQRRKVIPVPTRLTQEAQALSTTKSVPKQVLSYSYYFFIIIYLRLVVEGPREFIVPNQNLDFTSGPEFAIAI